MARGGIRFSTPLPPPPPLPAGEWGGKERGEGGAAAAAASPSGRPREEPLAALPKCKRQSGAALPPRPPLLPVRGEPRSEPSGRQRGAAGTPRLRCRPRRALSGPRRELPGWAGRALAGRSPRLSQSAAGCQLNPNKTPRKVFVFFFFLNQNKDENIHLKITILPERELFEHVMSNV